MIRSDAGCAVSRFAEMVGVSRRTYHSRLARHRAGDAPKGPWPAPVVDRIEPARGETGREVSGLGAPQDLGDGPLRRLGVGLGRQRAPRHGAAEWPRSWRSLSGWVPLLIVVVIAAIGLSLALGLRSGVLRQSATATLRDGSQDLPPAVGLAPGSMTARTAA